MLKKFLILFVALMTLTASAHAQRILFIPHDNRPVSCQQPADAVEQLGYEVLMPPLELLTKPPELWRWLNENAPSADAAVIASDALLYGGLIPSRSHEISAAELQARVENFKTLHEQNPNLNLYVFGSLMRTPHFGTPGDIEEPDYYGTYGTNIFQLTRLLDKQEIAKLNGKEKKLLADLQSQIPADILKDWFDRRAKNFSATKKLIDFAGAGIIDSLIIGRDDNAPLSQTHRENRQLLAYLKEQNIPKTKAQSHAGIDEYAILLLTHAVNDLRGETPFVNVQFNRGVGAKTVPDFSDEELGLSIRDEILLAGGMYVPNPARADFVLYVNTAPNGKTYESHNSLPPQKLSAREQKYFQKNAEWFAAQIEDAVAKNLPVGVADVAFANGSDNFLMEKLRDKNLLFKLQAYGGWNTATNTSGFAVSSGILARHMTESGRERTLAFRYLDDWAYQANVRTEIATKLTSEFPKSSDALAIYLHLGDHEADVVKQVNSLMHKFAEMNLPNVDCLKKFKVSQPWHRMFECRIDFD